MKILNENFLIYSISKYELIGLTTSDYGNPDNSWVSIFIQYKIVASMMQTILVEAPFFNCLVCYTYM